MLHSHEDTLHQRYKTSLLQTIVRKGMETYFVLDRHLSSKVRSYIFLAPQGMYSLAVSFEISSYVLGNLIAYRLKKSLWFSSPGRFLSSLAAVDNNANLTVKF